MLKVNDSLLLEDYEKLIEKKAAAKARIEDAAKAFAEARDYDEKQTADFIAYVFSVEGDGLGKDRENELAILEKYICEVEDVENVEEVAEEVSGEVSEEVSEEGKNAEISEVDNSYNAIV